MQLAGKKALVTGASRGVGRAIAEAFVASGIQVFGTSREPGVCNWPEGVQALALDASSPEAVERFWEQSGLSETGVDIVVNNAGAGVFGTFADAPFADWERQIGLMLLGPMKLSHLALGHWTRERPGVLVNVGSLAEEYPIPYLSGYNAAKAGLAAFSESLLLEVDPAAARVIELRLGDVDTGFNDSVARDQEASGRQDRVWQAMRRHTRRAPPPEKVARVLLKALRQDRQGTVRAGSLFQAVLASIFGRIVSQRARRASNLSYYNVRKR